MTVLVVDGLGHGPQAEEAAQAAVAETRRLLESQPDTPLERVIQACHRALSGTRGAAVALCRLDPDRGRALFSGVGNISMTMFPERKGVGISLPGVVGYRVRKTRVFETALAAGDTLALFTDGVSSRFSRRKYAGLPLEQMVEQAVAEHGKDHDDVTLLVLQVEAPGVEEEEIPDGAGERIRQETGGRAP